MTTKTDAMFTLFTERFSIITFDGNEVKLVPEGNGYHFTIKHTTPVYGKMDLKMTREQLLDLYTEGRLTFHQRAYVGSDLESALYDWD